MSTHVMMPSVPASVGHVLRQALAHAGVQLGMLVDREMEFSSTLVEYVLLEDLPARIGHGLEDPVTAVYLSFGGDVDGHVVLSLTPDAAVYLAQTLLMLDEPANTPVLQQLADSAIGELGNIATSTFLNAIAAAAGFTIHPSPPCVVHDMFGALLESVIAEVAMTQQFALLMRTDLSVDGAAIAGDLLLLPSLASVDRLQAALAGGLRF